MFPIKRLASDFALAISLERIHIIQCGFSIVCDPRVPSDFHSILGLQGVSSNLCKDSLDYITPYLTAARNKVRYKDYESVLFANLNYH